MSFNIVDLFSLIVISVSAAFQFFRAIDDLSLVFYETIGIIFACYLSNLIFKKFDYQPIFYLLTFIVVFFFSLLLARFFNNYFSFSFGIFTYIFGFFLALIFAWALCHAILKTILIFFWRNPILVYKYKKSLFVSQILFFGFFRELLGLLRVIRGPVSPQ
uniref:CvpA family protein n=1 Tax=candidate division WOR-3 bacterium TaxID=2052148 RepID=A0A7V4E2U4_UNCW3